ncbi:hypothetical protein H257_16995 [Aphanomyces astaci]|uniref:Isochorismatase-like domain-containing protein n=1 Tax=Aphanomyces astaci TaxID=112090 RepID=W4FGL2_APHAT|nr:hypothetical protein H257_16995 [Aphanomyces astaci]ETV66560.1 hypothetical protein H257_16995 [Aphanomyces astaci]RQM28500.1 hypothetical protein B5M09_007726 [Aphanomyces astaci]|eukprot:XP_009843931.1 hypothetical protein H257_16995 [Aphanomyces astaci]
MLAKTVAARVGKVAPASSLLLVCDIQEIFRTRIYEMPSVIHASNTLVQAAKTLQIPTVVTTQYAARFGPTVPELEFGPDVKTFDKTRFSMLTDDVRAELDATKPTSIILCGIEAHVCVLQTCLDLLEQGYDVHVPVDAVSSSTSLLRSTALTRLQQSGVYLTSVESIVFQLVRDSKHPDFRAISSLIKQHGAIPSGFHHDF